MPKTKDIHALRKVAGERYAAAAAALKEALVELAAIEGATPGVSGDDVPRYGFAAHQPDALPELRHREFLPHPPQGIREAVSLRRAALLAE